jgi:hypothetical protein
MPQVQTTASKYPRRAGLRTRHKSDHLIYPGYWPAVNVILSPSMDSEPALSLPKG